MSPAEARFWQRVTNRARALQPDVARALLRALQFIRDHYSEAAIAVLIESGAINRVLDAIASDVTLNAAYAPVRDRIRSGVSDGFRATVRELPKQQTVTVAFDSLNPRVIDAVRQLESKVITTLKESLRETVKQHVEAGLAEGVSPRKIAKGLRDVIGLSPTQEQAVRNFRTMLEAGDREALTRSLRDRRFDATLKRALGANGEGLSDSQIERMAEAYRKRMIAFNAETNARTAALDSMKLGQKLAIDDAVALGVYDPTRLQKTWIGVMDTRERPEHVAEEGDTVPYNFPFRNGEQIPGESTFNCRCVARYTQRTTA